MKFLVSISVLAFLLTGCKPPANSTTTLRPKVMRKPGQLVCQPEAKLMAAGVVGGEVVAKGDADDRMAVALITSEGLCTASVIGDDVLLTAAHCLIDEDPSQVEVILHPSISCESGFDGKAHTIVARKLVVHEGYNTSIEVKDRAHDIGLVFLSRKIPEQYTRFKIAPLRDLSKIEAIELFGYGLIGFKKGGRGILRKATLDADNLEYNSSQNQLYINQTKGKGICLGDSGGPTFVAIGEQKYVLGVSSYVTGSTGAVDVEPDLCLHTGAQTFAPDYVNWIESQVMKNSAQNSNP